MSLRHYLYLKNGNEIVQQQQYRGDMERGRLIEKWKHLYGKKFLSLTVIDEAPDKKEKYKPVKEDKYQYAGFHIKLKKSYRGSSLNKSWGYKD
jgi:hypothetical protein